MASSILKLKRKKKKKAVVWSTESQEEVSQSPAMTAHRVQGEGGGGKQTPNGPFIGHCLPLCRADADGNSHVLL